MPPPDYWPDARLIPKEQLRAVVEIIRAARVNAGLSNADLCRDVHILLERHNAVPGRTMVTFNKPVGQKEFSEQGKDELDATKKGTRKYLVGYLAWLCIHDESAARAVYKNAGLDFRPYEEGASITAEVSHDAGEHFADWNRLIDTHSRFKNIEIVALRQESLGLIDFMSREPVSERKLKLREPFCFRLDAPHAGYVLGFQRYRNRWYPMPLAARTMHDRIGHGLQALPRDPDSGEPVRLSEAANAGEYGFAFLVSQDKRLPELAEEFQPGQPLPNTLAATVESVLADMPSKIRVFFRINVLIEP